MKTTRTLAYVAALLALVIVLSACNSAEHAPSNYDVEASLIKDDPSESSLTSSAQSPDPAYSPYFQFLIDSGAVVPDYDIYKKPASENGKGDTAIVMSGRFDRVYQFGDLLIIDFLEGNDKNPYALILGVYSADLEDTYSRMLGKDVCIYGIYLGFSDDLNVPTATLYDTECEDKIYTDSFTNIISDGIRETAADYITFAEFNQIEDGMTYDEVVEIIGKDGTLSSQSGNVALYTWHGKNSGVASVMFVDNCVLSKSQAGLK